MIKADLFCVGGRCRDGAQEVRSRYWAVLKEGVVGDRQRLKEGGRESKFDGMKRKKHA
jgi:hypothetical protein